VIEDFGHVGRQSVSTTPVFLKLKKLESASRRKVNQRKGTHVEKIRVLFEDQDAVAHTPQSVSCGQASGGTSDDEKVESKRSLVGPVQDCWGHRRRGKEGMWGEVGKGGGEYIVISNGDEQDSRPICSPCQLNRIGKLAEGSLANVVRNDQSEEDVIFDRKYPELRPLSCFQGTASPLFQQTDLCTSHSLSTCSAPTPNPFAVF